MALDAIGLASLAILLVFVGFVLIALSLLSSAGREVSGGGLILIGPLPIAFGTSAKAIKALLLLALAALLATLLLLYASLSAL